MKHYTDDELTTKIKNFLGKKELEHPEIFDKQRGPATFSQPSLSVRLMQSLSVRKPLAS